METTAAAPKITAFFQTCCHHDGMLLLSSVLLLLVAAAAGCCWLLLSCGCCRYKTAVVYGKPKGTPFLCSRRSTRSIRSTLFLQPEKKKKVFLKFLFFIFLAFILLISKFNKSINDQLEGFTCKLCPLLSIPLHLYLISYYLDLISKIVSSIQFQFDIQQLIILHSFK